MMICPQCNATYTDDFLFCLTDGNALTDESGETPTVASAFSANMAPTEAMSICVACGHANRANSRFCKKCGKQLTDTQPETVFSLVPPPFMGHGQQFTPPVFTPPSSSGPQFQTQRNSGNQTMFIVAGALAVLVIVVGVIAYNAGGEKTTNNNSISPNITKAANAANVAANAANTVANAAANASRSSDSRIGKTGSLSTDCNLREYPNRDAFKLGTHYRGAQIKILETAEVINEDGGMSTWFRIEVQSYGASLDPKNYGLDKDPGTPDAGWVNSYPKVWDYGINGYRRVQLVEFD